MPLSDLPVEIFLNIADYLDDVATNALVRTNKDAHNLLNETLYRRAMTRRDMTNKSHSRSLLTWAIENEVIGTIQRAVHAATGRHFNPVPESFHIALQVATDKGHVPIVELLLKVEGINPNFHSGSLQAPLLIAARRGNSAIVELLLTKDGIDVNESDDHGTPLMVAVKNDHVEVVKSLLARADVDPNIIIPNRCGRTLLCDAVSSYRHPWLIIGGNCRFEPLEISKILLERDDIDVNVRDDKGRTALSWACINGCLELVDLILKKDNVDPNVRDNTGCTPLTEACRSSARVFGIEPLEILKNLLERDDIDINLRDDKGRTALFWACINDCLELVDLILKKDNIDPNVRDNTGHTPLAEACRSNVKPAVIRSLLSHRDTDPNAVDNNGVSPMTHCVENFSLKNYRLSAEIEALLLAAGANRRIG
ncbi:Ankyrin repeat-containing domain protein [Elaphomyces granulatus]